MIRNDLAPIVSLDGPWQFALGRDSAWSAIEVPGCWEAQGFSKWVDGPARYRRTFTVPADWTGSHIQLEFDAVSYACAVKVNGKNIGEHLGLWTPFSYDVTQAVHPGPDNLLELEVYKPGERYPMRETLAGFLPDIATTFGGPWQPARLRALTAGFHDLRLTPDFASCQLHVQGAILSFDPPNGPHSVQVDVIHQGAAVASAVIGTDAAGQFSATLPIPGCQPWSPRSPSLYTVTLSLQRAGRIVARCQERIGFRSFAADGERLLLNGEPIQLRGILSWGWEPDRLAPTYTVDQARALIRSVAGLGFNLIKLCLFVPNQTLYAVADEEGMLLWQEWPMWLPEVTGAMRARAPDEYAEYVELTWRHPSVVVHSVGCELAEQVDAPLLRQLDAIVRSAAPGALVCDNSGSSEAYGGAAIDLADFADYHTYGDLHFLEPMLDHWRRDWQRPRPLLFGEFCDSDGFRDPDEIIAAHGGEIPWWLTNDIPTHTWRPEVRAHIEARERLAHAVPVRTFAELVRIAAAQSHMVRKVTLEAVRRRAAVQGYVITGLRDTPVATSGVFDDLGRPKSPPADWQTINGENVLCLDVDRRRMWRHGGDRPDPIDCHNWWAGERVRLHLILNQVTSRELVAGQVTWRLHAPDGALHAEGRASIQTAAPAGTPVEIATIEFTGPSVRVAQEFRLRTNLEAGGSSCANTWPLWFYPRSASSPDGVFVYNPDRVLTAAIDLPPYPALQRGEPIPHAAVLITGVLDPAVLDAVQAGGAALLLQWADGPLPVRRLPFWREAIKLVEPHPIWEVFPEAGHVDLQFWGLATDTAFDTSQVPSSLPGEPEITPILRRLDAREFHVTDYLFEARVEQGLLMACSLRLQGGLGSQPIGLERNVAGRHLLSVLTDYLRHRSQSRG